MAEGTAENKKKVYQHKQNVRCAKDGWIICPSKKRPGLYYDFNTSTGEAVWRDEDITESPAAMLDNSGKYDCHEPTEPPSDSAYGKRHVTQSSITPNIDSQVMNNQFPAKPFPLAPFGNGPYAQYGLLNSSNNMAMNAAPTPMWFFPPPFLGPPIPPINPVQTIYEGLQNIQIQQQQILSNNNTSVPLNNRFTVLNHLNNENLPDVQLDIRKTYHTTPRKNPNFVKRYPNTSNDLRSLLSERRRQDQQHKYEVSEFQEPSTGFSRDLPTNVAEDEMQPDDNDEWLEAHTDSQGKKFNIDMECIWELADISASQDCWYMVTSSKVLLNNIRFLGTLAISDDRLRLLAPQEVVRGLRSATFSDKGRFAECAKRLLLTIRQNKLPNPLKDAAILKTCSELIEQKKHVVLLTDDKDVRDQYTNNVPIFSVKELKQFLTLNANRNDQTNTILNMQKVCEKIKIIVPNTADAKTETVSRVATTLSPSHPVISKICAQNVLKANETTKEVDDTETKTSGLLAKQTANAGVQTDFDFPVTKLAETTSEQETKNSPVEKPMISEKANDSTTSKAAPRKIKLKRQFLSSNVSVECDEKKTFRWRKRKDACSTPNLTSSVETSRKSCSASSFSNSTNDLTALQNDNAVDGGLSDTSLNAKFVEETSTSGVVSNSIDSETMFKINMQAILNKSRANHNEDIVMYEVTSDFMNDRLRTRCDEWAPHFFQIMEEVLSEVLHLEPAFRDETMPPPWNIQEAIPCIQRKFKRHCIIEGAADKLAAFLFKINDDKGNIKQDINSKEFMEMFSYGVNLVKVLQLELPNCEDLNIAANSLFKLLSDIREPNLDETDETFNVDNLLDNSANVSGTITSLSTDVPDNTVSGQKGSPRNVEKRMSCNNSPSRYSLRSNRVNIQKKNGEEKSELLCRSNNDEYSLFSSLGLQKNTFKLDTSITKTIKNLTQEQQPLAPIEDPIQGLTPDTIQDLLTRETKAPKITRTFKACPEMEMRCKGANNIHADLVRQEHLQDSRDAEECGVETHTEHENTENEHFIDENNCNLKKTAINVQQYCESTKSGDVDSDGIFKFIVQRTTYGYNSCLVNLRRFCEIVHEELKTVHIWEPDYKRHKMEKTIEASERAANICYRLKCILNREPSETKKKFRVLFNVFGVDDEMSDAQLSEYRDIIEKSFKHADLLLTFVKLLVELFKDT